MSPAPRFVGAHVLTGTLMDYTVPKADDLPSFELDRTVTPTPVNPLGAKGAGEAGAVGAPAAVVNASPIASADSAKCGVS